MNSAIFVTHENLDKTAVAKAMLSDVINYLESEGVVSHLLSATDSLDKQNTKSRSYFYRDSYGNVDLKSFFQFVKAYKLFYKVSKNKDFVFFRSYPSMILFGWFAKLMRKKIVFDTRGLFFEELIDADKVNRIVKFLFLPLEWLLLVLSNKIICVTNAQKEYYIRKYNICDAKFAVIANGAPRKILHSDLSGQDKLSLCYVGSLIKWHAPELVSSFCQELKSQGIEFSLHVITRDHDIAEEMFKDISDVKIYSHNYRNMPIKFDYGFCFIQGGVSKDVCYPVKFNEYLFSGTKILSLSNVKETVRITNELNCGLVFNTDESIKKMVSDFLDNRFTVDNNVVIPKELEFEYQCKAVFNLLKKL